MTVWTLHADRRSRTCTLVCDCGACGKPAAVVMNEDTYVRLVRDPDMPLERLAGGRTLRTGSHKSCERTA